MQFTENFARSGSGGAVRVSSLESNTLHPHVRPIHETYIAIIINVNVASAHSMKTPLS